MFELRSVESGVLEITIFGNPTGVKWELSQVLSLNEDEVDQLLHDAYKTLQAQGVILRPDDIAALYRELVKDGE